MSVKDLEDGGRVFWCTVCGGLASRVRLVPAGTAFDLGSPIGFQEHGRDGAVVERWLGTSWQALDPDRWARAAKVLAEPRPDAGVLHAIWWELAPFWCRRCRQSCCAGHWDRTVVMDEGFYDCTEGICPAGHRQMLDD